MANPKLLEDDDDVVDAIEDEEVDFDIISDDEIFNEDDDDEIIPESVPKKTKTPAAINPVTGKRRGRPQGTAKTKNNIPIEEEEVEEVKKPVEKAKPGPKPKNNKPVAVVEEPVVVEEKVSAKPKAKPGPKPRNNKLTVEEKEVKVEEPKPVKKENKKVKVIEEPVEEVVEVVEEKVETPTVVEKKKEPVKSKPVETNEVIIPSLNIVEKQYSTLINIIENMTAKILDISFRLNKLENKTPDLSELKVSELDIEVEAKTDIIKLLNKLPVNYTISNKE